MVVERGVVVVVVVGEIGEIVDEDLASMSLKVATQQHDELKELRVSMVKVNTELNLLLTKVQL